MAAELSLTLRYWGKARPSRPDASPGWHPLPYHSLDVAAVAHTLLARDQRLRERMALLLHLPEALACHWLTTLAALHDLGKFSHRFQSLRPDLCTALLGIQARQGTVRHDAMGAAVLQRHMLPIVLEDPSFQGIGTREERRRRRAVLALGHAFTAHHGAPAVGDEGLVGDWFSATDLEAAAAFTRHALALQPLARPAQAVACPPIEVILQATWFVAGFAVLCDWVGSNEVWFPYVAPDPMLDYWPLALARAERAVNEAGLLPTRFAPWNGVGTLLPAGAEPLPLQLAVDQMPLDQGPQLVLIEDVMGAGKTEAALALAQRLLAADAGAGVLVAMPTMATANALYDRLFRLAPTLIAQGETASLVLSHSRRDLHPGFQQTVLPMPDRAGDAYAPAEAETASAACTRWLADDRRRAFLAGLGVSSIDQAVLSVLPSRHQSLRLHGLARRILIVDEVHAYDAYVRSELTTLLRFHAALGGSAILLSATLPSGMRRKLFEAFGKGIGVAAPDRLSNDYPLVSRFGRGGLRETTATAPARLCRHVAVAWHRDEAAAIDSVVRHAAAGRAVCWIRNTVADALAAHAELRAAGISALLLHARFAAVDRQRIEAALPQLFGRDSTRTARAGAVLIATQVAEQSLDLDFDAMVSDLAPIDSVLQRAGRLHRHARADRPSPAPVLEVLSPVPVPGADGGWFMRALPRAGLVYPDHGRLWLTARLLEIAGGIAVPDDLRRMVDAVYAPAALEAIPPGLHDRTLRAEGDDHAGAGIGYANVLRLEFGYTPDGGRWHDDVHIPTRLGEPQTVVWLARWNGRALRPWDDGQGTEAAPWRAWMRSEVQLRRHLLAEAGPHAPPLQAAVEAARAQWRDRDASIALLPLEQSPAGDWIGHGRDHEGRAVVAHYHPALGLQIDRAR